MGMKLNALFGRSFKTSKFKALVNLAISRIAVLKNQRHVKLNQARSDVIQLLQQGHHDRALHRVEHVIKEQNMLDAFVMIESYCYLLIERVHLLEQQKACPDELTEAVSTILFAASRCGEFPELQEIRVLFTSRYGKEFAARAIELRNKCAVNPKMIQKLSTRQPVLENRLNVLKQMAAENNIVLQLEEASFVSIEGCNTPGRETVFTSTVSAPTKSSDYVENFNEEMVKNDIFSDSMKVTKKFKDAADAAQAAFESATFAASAARAAVELSRTGPHNFDDRSSPTNRRRKPSERYEHMKLDSEFKTGEIHGEIQALELKQSKNGKEQGSAAMSTSSSDSEEEENVRISEMSFDEVDPVKLLEQDIVLDESDDEDLGSSPKRVSATTADEVDPVKILEKDIVFDESDKEEPHIFHKGLETKQFSIGSGLQSKQNVGIVKGAMSVRTRRVRGC